MSGSQPETDGDMVRVKGHLRGNKTYLAREADDAQVPVVVLIDRDHHEILLKYVDLPGPALHLIVSPRQRLLPSLYRRGGLDEATEPVSGEDVNPEQIGSEGKVNTARVRLYLSLSASLKMLYWRCFM